MLLAGLAIVWLLGIYMGVYLALPVEAAIALIATACLLIALWWRNTLVRFALLACVVILFAILRSQSFQTGPGPDSIARYNDGGPVFVRGVVADDPVPAIQAVEIRIDVREARVAVDEPWQRAQGLVLLRQGLQPERRYGDLVEAHGTLETPNESGDFNYRQKLARQHVYSVMRYPGITTLGRNEGWLPFAFLHEARDALAGVLERTLPEPQASLAAGILLGKRGNMPGDLTADFARTNTTHIIAISGANVSLVAAILLLVCRSIFGRRPAVFAAILGIVSYAFLVGTAPSVVRASLMGIVYVLGDHFGRQRDTTVALALSAVAMTLVDPPVLLDLGFQLSFLGTAGLVLFEPLIRPKLSRLPDMLADLVAPTVAAEVATMPLIMLTFGQISVVGPVANLIVPPLLPPVMISSGFAAVLGLLSPLLGQLAATIAWLFLSAMTLAVETLSAIPFAALPIGRPGLTLVLACYALLAVLLLHLSNATTPLHASWRLLHSRLPAVPTIGALSLATAVVWSIVLSLPSETLRLSVLDVGQGDAILLQTPEHKLLIDGGPSPDAVATALGKRLPFWDRNIDLLVLTHPNEDHLAGLIGILERYEVRSVLDTGIPQTTATYLRYQQLVRERGVTHLIAKSGQVIDLGRGATLHVLHAGNGTDPTTNVNDTSIVLRLVAPDFTALLTGDIGPAARASLLASGEDLRATVLKVPHHGSSTGLDDAFLSAASPEIGVVSVGRGNRFGHPAPDTLALLARHDIRVYRTDLNGTTEFVETANGYRVVTQR